MSEIKHIKILFIHHSVGGNLINQGSLRQMLKNVSPGIELWDHAYNCYKNTLIPNIFAKLTFHTGLSDAQGKQTGIDYTIVLSNDSPKEYAEIFSRNQNDPTLSAILQYDIVAFKNCYSTTKITSEEQLFSYKHYYETIRDGINKYKNKKFILVTPPPLRKEVTNSKYAKRAKQLIQFLNSNNFLNKAHNLVIFDFFALLADDNGFLKKEYTRRWLFDSHPNRKANEEIAPILANFLYATVKNENY